MQEVRHPSGNVRQVQLLLGAETYVAHGVFGNVYKTTVYNTKPPTTVAVKKIWPVDSLDFERQKNIYRFGSFFLWTPVVVLFFS